MKLSIFCFTLIFTFYGICSSSMEETDDNWHCKKLNFNTTFDIDTKNQITIVYNSALCKRCFQKLIGFKSLQLRFEIADYDDLSFIMLTTETVASQQFNEIQSRAGRISVISLNDVTNNLFDPGSVSVFDKCSRLTYQMIPPWSEFQYHLVKAAILSTWYDGPCGYCEFDNDDTIDLRDNSSSFEKEFLNTTENPEEENETHKNIYINQIENGDPDGIETDPSYVIPMKIIVPVEHLHSGEANDSNVKYNFMILSTNNSSFHGHFEDDDIEILTKEKIFLDSNLTSTNNITEKTFINEEGVRYEVTKSYKPIATLNGNNLDFKEISPVHNVEVKISPPKIEPKTERETLNSTILASLQPWLSFRLTSIY